MNRRDHCHVAIGKHVRFEPTWAWFNLAAVHIHPRNGHHLLGVVGAVDQAGGVAKEDVGVEVDFFDDEMVYVVRDGRRGGYGWGSAGGRW